MKCCRARESSCSLIVEVDEPRPELDLGRRALVLEDDDVLQDDGAVAQLPRDARVVLQQVTMGVKWVGEIILSRF